MKNSRKLVVVLTGALFLSACQSTGDKELIGTLGGAGLGALAGSQFGGGTGKLVAVAVGTLGGAFIGKSIGKNLDEVDLMMANKSQQAALETGPSHQRKRWRNPDTGHSGSVTPKPAYEDKRGQVCREFEHEVTIDGQSETAVGKACRRSDGRWEVKT